MKSKPIFMSDDLEIRLFVSDLFMENTWIVLLESVIYVVDPGRGSKHAVEELKLWKNVESVKILLTHGHVDHIHDLSYFRDADIYVHEADLRFLIDSPDGFFQQFGIDISSFAGLHFVDFSTLGDHWKVIHTPGHTPGSCCYLLKENYLFSGDTVFSDSIGRTDLPGGDWRAMETSLESLTGFFREKPDMLILPGHGPTSTAKRILLGNPFFT